MASVSMSLGTPLGKGRESNGAKDAAVIREIMTGEALRRQIGEKKREEQARREALEMKNHRSIGSLGKCVANIPGAEYYALCAKYGREEVHSKGFMQYLYKTHPDLCPNRA